MIVSHLEFHTTSETECNAKPCSITSVDNLPVKHTVLLHYPNAMLLLYGQLQGRWTS